MDMRDTYLMSATVGLKSGFHAAFALRATWENVSSADDCSDALLQTPEGCPVCVNIYYNEIVENVASRTGRQKNTDA